MKKLKFENFTGGKVLTRSELKEIVGGFLDDGSGSGRCSTRTACSYHESGTGNVTGVCETNSANKCVCATNTSSTISNGCVA